MIHYRPSPEEMVAWGRVGLRRAALALANNRRQMYGRSGTDNRWGSDVEAAIAEGIVAKHMDTLDWWKEHVAKDQSDRLIGDVWPKVDVKNTKYASGHLLIHDDYPDEHVFILVTGELGEYIIRGSILAKDAKKKKFAKKSDRGGEDQVVYWVPQAALDEFDAAVILGLV